RTRIPNLTLACPSWLPNTHSSGPDTPARYYRARAGDVFGAGSLASNTGVAMARAGLCLPIEMIHSDVDGVLTDGGVIFDNQGIETKRFHIRDGLGVKLWRRAGGKFGIITGRTSHIVSVRAAELGIDIVRQGTDQKLAAAREIISQHGLRPEQVCY